MVRKDGAEAVLFWSGGKDSAFAFHQLRTRPEYEGLRVVALLTTFTEGYDRVTGHGVRRSVIERQVRGLGLDLLPSYIPQRASMSQYVDITARALHEKRAEGVGLIVSGDLFVEKERMALVNRVGLDFSSPLWLRNSRRHVEELVDLGFETYVVCVDGRILDASFVGRRLDHDFVRDLPTGVDPAGENGEFHTLVVDGPIFQRAPEWALGEVVHREGFHFCDVVP